jgi:hypothetical protein
MGYSATTPEEINVVVLVTLKAAIKMYLMYGIKVNRAYTPTKMLAKAGELLGKEYKRGQLSQAFADLQARYDEILVGRN